MKHKINPLWVIPVLIVIAVGVYYLPPVHDRLSWRVEDLQTRIKYALNPPDEAVFVPKVPTAATLAATLPPTPSPVPTGTPVPAGPTLTPTPTPTPLPEQVKLDGVVYVDQHERWNYCGPANLSMALNFWGWKGNRDDIAKVVKPGVQDPKLDFIQQGKLDKNVMPYELSGFVQDYTEFNVVVRHGGDLDLVKRLIAAGFPVVVEKGYYEADYTGKIAWLGHYLFTTGYDDAQGAFIVQDAWLKPGKDVLSPYEIYEEGWRGFNYLFMVVYPPAREQEVFTLLGPWLDSQWANEHALEKAEQDIAALGGIDQFFAWFNKGTSLVNLLRYGEATLAYDQAFQLYASLGQDDKQRPYRIMWYQTGPYWAYYYSGRYQDVINLANTTLNDTISEPTLEESLYWRGLAEFALGDSVSAFADVREAVRLNPNFTAGLQKLREWGISP